MSGLHPGAVIDGRYTLSSKLGDGGAGELWRASDGRMGGRAVAVRFPYVASTEVEVVATALASLQHPNLLPILDRGSSLGRSYLVTELAEGPTLAAWLDSLRARNQPPDLALSLALFDQVLAGVEAAHRARATHGDLRPNNVFLRETPSGLDARVGDFGLSTGAPNPAHAPWHAPERLSGRPQDVGPWSDVFSLGVMLVELLTLRPVAPGGETWAALSTRFSLGLRDLLSGLRQDVPPAVWEAAASALQSEIARRPADAGALRQHLRQATASVPRQATPAPSQGAFGATVAMPMPPPQGAFGAGAPTPPSAFGGTMAMPQASLPGASGSPFQAPFPGAPPPQGNQPFPAPSNLFTPPPGMGGPSAFGAPSGGAFGPPANVGPFGPPANVGAFGPPANVGAFGPPGRPPTSQSSALGVVIALVAVFGMFAAGAGFFLSRRASTSTVSYRGSGSYRSSGSTGEPQADSARIPVGRSPVLGRADAMVTLVVFSDFECPFCGRLERTLTDLRSRYGDDLRIVWKNQPLPFHTNALPAAEAAMAAHAQGRFWEMHDRLFENRANLTRLDFERYALSLGLDLTRFRNDLDAHSSLTDIQGDQALAQTLGATGTPTCFINGTRLSGAQPLERFTSVIDSVLARARTIYPRSQVYARMVESPVASLDTTTTSRPSRDLNPETVYRVPVGESPVRGTEDALVTMVVFSDFQCPFCARAERTVDALRARYGRDLRVVWKNQPLAFHENAMPAAEAALEAYSQRGTDGFWRMHDTLFQNNYALSRRDLERYGEQVGLSVSALRRALEDRIHRPTVEADMALAREVGATGTPTFFINGRRLTGAQPQARFEALIDRGRAEALALVRSGVPRTMVYERLTLNGATAPVYRNP